MNHSFQSFLSKAIYLLLTVSTVLITIPSLAQESDPFSYAARIQPSAEAWQIARHGEISPDLHTGAMAWSLPLYTYKDEDFTIPISLDYRFDGCRPSQPAGTVGMGWNLNCGGVITRQVVGLPDDYIRHTDYIDHFNEHHESWQVGFYFATIDHSVIPPVSLNDSLNTEAFLNDDHCVGQISPVLLDGGNNSLTLLMGTSPLISCSKVYHEKGIVEGGPYFDPNTDVYHFSVLGLSGDFIILPSGAVKVYNCSAPEGEIQIKIIFSQLLNGGCFSRIALYHKGYQYLFGGDLSHIEYSFDASTEDYNDPTDPTRYCFSALRLNQITAPNGRIVRFDHSAVTPCSSVTWKGSVHYRMEGLSGTLRSTAAVASNLIYKPVQSIVVDNDTLVKMHYADKGYAEFGYSAFPGMSHRQYQNILPYGQGTPAPDTLLAYNKANRLESLVIHNRSGELIDSIAFRHSYTTADAGHSPKMFLESLEGNAGLYSFGYLFPSGYPAYPSVNSVETDHWGYWNGGSYPFSPNDSNRQRQSLYDLPHSGKDPDSLKTRQGALYRIAYPSGGWSQVVYENNTASRCVELNTDDPTPFGYDLIDTVLTQAGGVRVKSITNHSGPFGSFEGTTDFDYCNSGVLMQMPRYFIEAISYYESERWVWSETLNPSSSGLQPGQLELITCDNNGLPLSSSDGHILYTKVSTHQEDGSFSEQRFSDPGDIPDRFLRDSGESELYCAIPKRIEGQMQGGDPVSEQYSFSVYGDTPHNTSSANILLSDFSCLRGKTLVELIYAADSTLIRKSEYAWSADTAATTLGVYNSFSCFIMGDRSFVQPRLDSVITTEYLPGGGSLSDTTLYTYNNLGQQTIVEKRSFDGSVLRSRLRYEHESDSSAPRANVSEAASTRLVAEGGGMQEYVTSLRHFEYDADSARRHLPVLAVDYGKPSPWVVSADTTIGWFSPLSPDDSTVRRLSYNVKHRPVNLLLPGDAYVAFVWDNSGRYLLSREDNGPSMVSTYQWKDMVGLTRKTDATLRSEWYAYDSKWRLSEVRRADSVMITAYDYHLWCEDSTAGPSYTKQTTWRTSSKNNRDIVYYDGLGYPIQKVRTSTQTQWGHIITPIRYDALRRDDARAFLPYEARYSTYNSSDSVAQSQYYKLQFGNSEVYPYAEKVYGTSPAGRLLSSRQPGKDYADSSKVVTYDYRTNNAADSILDLTVTVSAQPQLRVGTAYLPAGRLLLTKTTDEDGCTSEVFTDASGKTVLSRQQTGGQRLDTYRVYDLRDSLVCVLQPEGAASIQRGSSHALLPPVARNDADTIPTIGTLLDNYAFLYAWDSWGRLAAKKRPGAAAEEFLSDDRGRVVLSRDGNLRNQGKWLFSEYDEYDALLKKSLIEVGIGMDTLRLGARAQIDSSLVMLRDTVRLWEFLLDADPDLNRRAYSKSEFVAEGDSLFDSNGYFLAFAGGHGVDNLGFYILVGDRHYYPDFNSILLDPVWDWQIDRTWRDTLVSAITNSTLLEEHRYDRGDSPGIPQALDFMSVTGIATAADTSSTRNLEVWQRQLMLPPGRTVPGDTTRYVERAFYYDVPGNLVQTVETNALGGVSRTSTKYDYLGNVTVSEEKHTRAGSATADVKRTSYSYDNQGRISSEYVALNNTTVTETEFDYDIFGHLTWTWGQGDEAEKALQEMYSYDIRGRLLSKEAFRMFPYEPGPDSGGGGDEEEEEEEDPEWDAVSLFNMALRYNHPLKSASSRKWNGLISEIAHQRGDNGVIITNDYYYDNAGRLVDNQRYDGNSQTNKYTERDLSFDRNGNILTLKRYGTNVAAPQDNLAYTYEGNKLMQLNNATYQYDANGNMTVDERRHLLLSWNHLNLPATISNDEDEDATVNYTYLSDGTKVLAEAPGTSEGYAYLGTMVYKLNNGTWSLETTPFTGGRFVRNAAGNFVEQRHITDHLGSTRTIVEGDDYTEVEQNDYYPFGKRIADNTLPTTTTNRWRFSGKEIQTLGGIGLVDFGARLYDYFRGQWPTQDVMAEKYFGLSPYGYCVANPVNMIDPFGHDIYYFDTDGNYLRKENKKGHHIVAINSIDENGNESYKYYSFADSKNDPQAIDNGVIKRIAFISDDWIRNTLDNQGAFDASKIYFIKESKGGGSFDYSTAVLCNEFSNGSIEYKNRNNTNGNEPISSFLFLPEGDNMVHNLMNFGNYLWSATGQVVGFGLGALKFGANINSLMNSKTNSYSPQFDSRDDLRSIKQGYKHAKKHHYGKH